MNGDAPTPKRFMGYDGGGCCGGVPVDGERVLDDSGEEAAGYDNQVERAGNPCEARP